MNRTRVRSLIDTYVSVAPPILSQHFTPSCCLNGTRVLVDTMKTFGLRIEPVVVEMIAYNKVWADKLALWGCWPRDAEQKREFMDAGGYALAVDGDEDSEGWPHHLVGFEPKLGVLIDSSSGQTSRPTWALTVPQVTSLKVPGSFVSRPQFAAWETPEGATVAYRAKPGISFRHLPGWQNSPWNQGVTNELTVAMKERL